jgi:hypothetical protein
LPTPRIIPRAFVEFWAGKPKKRLSDHVNWSKYWCPKACTGVLVGADG